MVIVYQGRNSHSGRLGMIKYMIRRIISRVQLLYTVGLENFTNMKSSRVSRADRIR